MIHNSVAHSRSVVVGGTLVQVKCGLTKRWPPTGQTTGQWGVWLNTASAASTGHLQYT